MADMGMTATRPLRELYVLGEVDGSFYHPTFLSRDFSALVRQYGLMGTQGKKPTFYSLRHTFATVALRSGVDVKTMSSLMVSCLNGWDWWMTEYDPGTREAFGLVQGFADEWGYFSIAEMEELNRSKGFNVVEREGYFKPKPVSECRR